MGQDEDDDVSAGFEQHRPRLRALAERLLGSSSDAEDAVQESWLRLRGVETATIDNLGGWLTTVTSRICLDRLRARHARPETLLGRPDVDHAGPDDPEADAVVADAAGRAVAVVLDSLSPAERVAFVLHDVFAVPFDQIAPVLERSTEATKKLAGRARHRARLAADDRHDLDGRRQVIARFLDALREGDVSAMLAVLAPDATRLVDPALLTPGRPTAVHGAHAIVEEARRSSAPARDARPATIDGQPGAAVIHHGVPTLALVFTITGGLVDTVEVIGAPERLEGLSIEPTGV